jgi:hypothetical protein
MKPVDPNDILRARGVDELRRVLDELLAEDIPHVKGNGRDHDPPPVRFKLIRFNEFKLDEHDPYIVKGLLPAEGLVVVWGPPKCGKSFWVLDLLMHAALGREYRGLRVEQGPIVYCALEGVKGFKKRIAAFRQEKLKPEDDPDFHLMTTPLSLIRDVQALVADIRTQIGDVKPAAVCIDTLNRSLAGSESSDEDMAAYIRAVDAIRDAFDCLVIVVHHCGHEGQRPRGHSSLMGALDVQIAVRKDIAGNVVAEVELSKDGEAGLAFTSRLKVVEIGRDQEVDHITSCVIEAVDGTATTNKASKPARLAKSAKNALRALEAAIAERGEIPPASNHIPIGVRAVSVCVWRDYAYRMGVSGSDEARARQKAFKDGWENLVASGHVAVWDPWVWIVRSEA